MKRKTGVIRAAVSLAVLIAIISTFTVNVFADAGSFGAAVNAFDKNGTYVERLSAFNAASELYAALSPEELEELVDVIALYNAEAENLQLLKERAERFISTVNSLADMPDLDDKLLVLQHIKTNDNYVDDITIEGIEEALLALQAYEERIIEARDACDAFIGYSDVLSTTDITDYLTIRAALDGAEACQAKMDLTYDGVIEARNIFMNIKTVITKRETYTEEFLYMTGEALKQESYKDKKKYYDYAMDYVGKEDYLPDYPGAVTAENNLAELAEELKDDIAAANVFVSWVTRIGSGESIAKDIIGALAILAEVDRTAPGVENAERILNEAKDSYNSSVKKINADFSAL